MLEQNGIARQAPEGVAPKMKLARIAAVPVRSARHVCIRAAPTPGQVREALAHPHAADEKEAAHTTLRLLQRHGTGPETKVRRGGRNEAVHTEATIEQTQKPKHKGGAGKGGGALASATPVHG